MGRSERVRWEEKRIQVYADYGHTVKRTYELSKRISRGRGLPTTVPVPLENRILLCELRILGSQVARTYSLIRPLRTGFRRIW